MTTDFGIEPVWERWTEIGFFKSIVLTIRGVMFRPAETFSRFRWEGGYWDPILLCLLGNVVSGFGVLCFTEIFYPIFGGNFEMNVLVATSVGLLLGWFLGVAAEIASLFLFSALVLGALRVLRIESPSYQRIFRVVAYTSILISILSTFIGFVICAIMPKPLWDALQTVVLILLMIWQGYCIVVGLSKTTSTLFWKPVTAVVVAMLLAYGSVEITSLSNPIGHRIWDAAYHAITGNNFQS